MDLLTGKITYFNLIGGCKGYSCIDEYVYTPHYSFAVVTDEKKMKNLSSELKAGKELEKHKERIMKKNQGTSIQMKKVVNLEFQKQINSEKVTIGFQPTIKKVEGLKEVKIPLKEGLGGFGVTLKRP